MENTFLTRTATLLGSLILLYNAFTGPITPVHAEEEKGLKQEQKQEEKQKTELETIIDNAAATAFDPEKPEPNKALSMCETALKQYPTSAEIYFLMGHIHEQGGYPDKAQGFYQAAFEFVKDRFQPKMYAEDIYKNGISADWLYPGGRVVPHEIILVKKSEKDLLTFKTGEWVNYYFDAGETSKKLQQILKEDPLIDFDKFDEFMRTNHKDIRGVSLDPCGFLYVVLGNDNFICAISKDTEEKIYKL